MSTDSLLELIAGTLGIHASEVTDTSDRTTLKKWDSLRHIMLMMELETNYGIQLSEQEMTEATSVAKIRTALSRHGIV